MSLFKRGSAGLAGLSTSEPKSAIQHVETSRPVPTLSSTKENYTDLAASHVHDGQIVDAETAKYLDPTIVIDAETNRGLKRMVGSVRGCWVLNH